MRSRGGLFDEFAAAFQFPHYFGENWDALDECLGDLEWLPAAGYILLVYDAMETPRDEAENQFGMFVGVLSWMCERWAKKGIPCHVLLHCEEKDAEGLRSRFQSIGAGMPACVLSG